MDVPRRYSYTSMDLPRILHAPRFVLYTPESNSVPLSTIRVMHIFSFVFVFSAGSSWFFLCKAAFFLQI